MKKIKKNKRIKIKNKVMNNKFQRRKNFGFEM